MPAGSPLPDLAPLFAALSLLPVLGAAWRRRARLSPALRLFTGYLVLELLLLVALALPGDPTAVDPMLHTVLPPRVGLVLLSLAAWHPGGGLGRVLRGAGLIWPLLWLPTLLGWEARGSLGLGLDTAQWLLCLAVAAFVVVRQSMEGPSPATGQAWFWVGSGIMLIAGTRALAAPLGSYLDATGQASLGLGLRLILVLAQLLASALYARGVRTIPATGPALPAPAR